MGDVSKTISLGKDGLIKTSGDGSSGDGSGISTSSIGTAISKAGKGMVKAAAKVAYKAKGRSFKKKESKTRTSRPGKRP